MDYICNLNYSRGYFMTINIPSLKRLLESKNKALMRHKPKLERMNKKRRSGFDEYFSLQFFYNRPNNYDNNTQNVWYV